MLVRGRLRRERRLLRNKIIPTHARDECAALLVWKPSESPMPLEIHGPPVLATAFKHAIAASRAQLAHYAKRYPSCSPQRFESLCGFNLPRGETASLQGLKLFQRDLRRRAVYPIFSGGSRHYSVKSLLMRYFFCAETQANRRAPAARTGVPAKTCPAESCRRATYSARRVTDLRQSPACNA